MKSSEIEDEIVTISESVIRSSAMRSRWGFSPMIQYVTMYVVGGEPSYVSVVLSEGEEFSSIVSVDGRPSEVEAQGYVSQAFLEEAIRCATVEASPAGFIDLGRVWRAC